MFCKECGAPVKDGARFCEYCGLPVEVPEPTPAPEPEPIPPEEPKDNIKSLWTEGETEKIPAVSKPADPVRPLLRKLANSGAIWVLVIALTLSMLLSVIGIFTMRPGEWMEEFRDGFFEGFDEAIREYPEIEERIDFDLTGSLEDIFTSDVPESLQQAVSIGTIGFSIAAKIPAILILIGVWLVFCSVKSKKERASCAGIRLIRGVTVYECVAFCVLFGLFLIPLLVLTLYLLFTAQTAGALIALLCLLFFALIALPGILYYAKLLRTLRAMQNAIDISLADCRASRYVAVICILFAVGSLFTLAFNPLSGICNIAVYISAAILLFRYREEMQRMRLSPEYRAFSEGR